jgi:hypothetical protein
MRASPKADVEAFALERQLWVDLGQSLLFGLIRCAEQLCCGAIDKNRPEAVIY